MTDTQRHVAAIRERLDRAPNLATVARRDFDWLLSMVEDMEHALTTVYWMIHGSESGRAWSGREAAERVIQEPFRKDR